MHIECIVVFDCFSIIILIWAEFVSYSNSKTTISVIFNTIKHTISHSIHLISNSSRNINSSVKIITPTRNSDSLPKSRRNTIQTLILNGKLKISQILLIIKILINISNTCTTYQNNEKNSFYHYNF